MSKLQAILKKELLLLSRDFPGLIILFIMPVLLIFVVTLAQENAVKIQQIKTPVLWVDETKDPGSEKIIGNLQASGFFQVINTIDHIPVTRTKILQMISCGDYKFGVVVQSSDSSILLILDPTLQENYRNSVVHSLTYLINTTLTHDAMDKLIENMAGNMKPIVDKMIQKTMRNLPVIKETFALKDKSTIKPNVIQNNVPGFILFAMFFIVIPLAGSMITEKKEGSFQRLSTLPIGFFKILTGKVLIYFFVCMIQFVLMMSIGLWVFPTFFGFPALQIGHQYFAIIISTISASLAAIGFGLLVGALSTTQNQAALFGSVMVVILGVLSGTFLPIYLMPNIIQYVSYLSPMRWGIDNYINLFIREGDLISVLPNTILLLLFFGFAMKISIVIFAKRN
ncbi:MAG: ABC transporter permease [Bacteroidales bacterium]|nr:ABC transporter permease [Bacteroidales bacterium]